MPITPSMLLIAEGEGQLLSLLETFVQVNTRYLQTHPSAPHLYDAGVRYEREEGREDWLSYPVLLARGRGDCEDLAAALAAWYRARLGIQARVVLRRYHGAGKTWYHAIVKLPDGTLKDPSRKLGM